MQITFNQSEVEGMLAVQISTVIPGVEPEEIRSVQLNEDGTVLVIIGEEVASAEDTPPVVEKKTRKRREAKHVMVEKKEEEPAPEPAAQGEDEVDPNSEIQEKAVAEAKKAAAEEASDYAAVAEEVQEKEVERPASSKPSLFANLKR